jgi:hypothetical protein
LNHLIWRHGYFSIKFTSFRSIEKISMVPKKIRVDRNLANRAAQCQDGLLSYGLRILTKIQKKDCFQNRAPGYLGMHDGWLALLDGNQTGAHLGWLRGDDYDMEW